MHARDSCETSDSWLSADYRMIFLINTMVDTRTTSPFRDRAMASYCYPDMLRHEVEKRGRFRFDARDWAIR